MTTQQNVGVAVLLATYNGSRFVESQIRSLKDNDMPFTLHWLDDQSTDDTRDVVRTLASDMRVNLKEWHQPKHQGVPGAFFQLLECVESDVYLFCDQDDIWQPGKIDATVRNLLPDLSYPALCFSNLLMFRDGEPSELHRFSDVMGANVAEAMEESRLFMCGLQAGNTQGFTRPLRDIFLTHNDIARAHAIMHDAWMYLLAVAAGRASLLDGVPTTLYRVHPNNASNDFGGWGGKGAGHLTLTRENHQFLRRGLALQAEGFMLAAPTLPQGPKLERLKTVARLVAKLDRRQSPLQLARLASRGILWPNRRMALGLAAACLSSNANTGEHSSRASV